MKPQRVQLRRVKGWRMPPNTVKVDRTTYYGNPFVVVPCAKLDATGSRNGFVVREYETNFFAHRHKAVELSVRAFRAWLEHPANHKTRAAVNLLRGKNLACWCPPGQPCHADILLEIANDGP